MIGTEIPGNKNHAQYPGYTTDKYRSNDRNSIFFQLGDLFVE